MIVVSVAACPHSLICFERMLQENGMTQDWREKEEYGCYFPVLVLLMPTTSEYMVRGIVSDDYLLFLVAWSASGMCVAVPDNDDDDD